MKLNLNISRSPQPHACTIDSHLIASPFYSPTPPPNTTLYTATPPPHTTLYSPTPHKYHHSLPHTRPSSIPVLEGSVGTEAVHDSCQFHIELVERFLYVGMVQLVSEAEVVKSPEVGAKVEGGCLCSSQFLT